MRFEWVPNKATANLRKHRVSFDEAASVFYDDFAIQFFDDAHSTAEERFLMLGMSSAARLQRASGLLIERCAEHFGEVEETRRRVAVATCRGRDEMIAEMSKPRDASTNLKSAVLLVCHCERGAGTSIRIISARKATTREASHYRGGRHED